MLFSHRHWAGPRPVITLSAIAPSAIAPSAITPSAPCRRPLTLRLMAVIGCAILGNGLMALPRAAAWGQTVSSATVTEVLDSPQVFIQNRQVAVNSVAQRQQRVRTQAARASLQFNNGAVARLAHNSSLMVGQCAQLNRGTLLVNGSLNGCTTTTMAGVRGTLYTLEVTEEGETMIKVFEGEVAVGQRTDAVDPDLPEDPDALGDDLLEDGLNDSGLTGDDLNDDQADNGQERPQDGFAPPVALDELDPDELGLDGAAGAEDTPTEPPESETVVFSPDTVLVISEGQQVMINTDTTEAIISRLTAEDFIHLLEGPLIQGFRVRLPGLGHLQRSFRRLFPRLPMLPMPPVVPSLGTPQPTPSPNPLPNPPTPSFPFPW